MILTIEKEYEIKFDFSIDEVAKKVISYAFSKFNIPYEYSATLITVDNDSIREINNEQRGIDRATDVLSFPAIEYEKEGVLPNVEEIRDVYFDPENDSLYMGDIILSLDKVKEQAKEYGHSEYREFSFLLIHSCLHLMGYDHMNDVDEERMFKLQREILDELEISR